MITQRLSRACFCSPPRSGRCAARWRNTEASADAGLDGGSAKRRDTGGHRGSLRASTRIIVTRPARQRDVQPRQLRRSSRCCRPRRSPARGEGNIAGALGRVTGLQRRRRRLRLCPRPRRPLFAGAAQRLAAAQPRAAAPRRPARPLSQRVIASSLVQKSYSANFPGEFGGGVINLTTSRSREDRFLTIGAGIGGDTETTDQLGYTYYGSKTDWTGFDNGNRDMPPALAASSPAASGSAPAMWTPRRSPSELVNAQRARPEVRPPAAELLGQRRRRQVLRHRRHQARPDRRRRLQQQVADPRRHQADVAAARTCRTVDYDFRRVTTDNRVDRQRPRRPGLRVRRRQPAQDALDQPLHPRHDQAHAPRPQGNQNNQHRRRLHAAGHRLVRARS